MKRLLLVNLSLLFYFSALICSIGISYSAGAIMAIIASLGILVAYVLQLKEQYFSGKLLSWDSLAATIGTLLVAEVFLQGYSISIGHSVMSLSGFYHIHVFAGFLVLTLFTVYSVRSINTHEDERNRTWLLIAVAISTLISLLGYLGFARILSGTVRYIYYSFVFLLLAYSVFFLFTLFKRRSSEGRAETMTFILCLLMVFHWVLRWLLPHTIEPGFVHVVFNIAFFPIIVLPIAIFHFRRLHFIIVFILQGILLDIYFISFDRDFKYLVDAGINGCVGYEHAVDYPVVQHPGISISELCAPPSAEEITSIVDEWKARDFTPREVRTVFAQRYPNGDSLKVFSHLIHGKLHYGLIRIPTGINVKKAPILLVLNGGGADVDVVDANDVHRVVSGVCRDVLDRYVLLAPAFRGDIIRGDGFCFRSEGYTGDVWAGAAEDAAYFLQVVKASYAREENALVLAIGISRGATVGLILGALTNKVDRIISISTHTDFLNEDVLYNERVGYDFPKVFFTPRTSPDSIRRRMLTSSPRYFAEYLPPFEIHQGTDDQLTTVQHTQRLEERLKALHRSDSTFRIYYYQGKGHGYDDDALVCKTLRDFVKQ
jgi:hypothetical protein